MLCYLEVAVVFTITSNYNQPKVIYLQEVSEINSKPSARYALALFSLCTEGKTNNEMEKYDRLVLVIATWDFGEWQEDWEGGWGEFKPNML
mgnify:CR=1 FL=1